MAALDKLALKKASRAIQQIAREQRITEAEVRAEMEAAILDAYNNPDPAVKVEWAKAPFAGRIPTVEEFIAWCAEKIQNEI